MAEKKSKTKPMTMKEFEKTPEDKKMDKKGLEKMNKKKGAKRT